jgi:hypothetical protein
MARTQSMKHDFGVLGQTQTAHSAANGSPAFSRGVLHSWKDISKYTGRGLRTVQRYEAQLGLPVHRVAGKKHTAVMAFTDEIDHWLRTRPQSIADDEAAAENHSAEMTVEQAKQAVQKAYEAFQIALQRYLQVERSSGELRSARLWNQSHEADGKLETGDVDDGPQGCEDRDAIPTS